MSRDELRVRTQMADRKIEALKRDFDLFCENQRPNIKITRVGNGGIAVPPPISIPIEMSIRIGVIAYLLRSSLDHLVCRLIAHNGNTPSYRSQFPLRDNVVNLPANMDEKLKGLSKAHDQIIRGFSGVDPTIWPFPLVDLNIICNTDKHRHPLQTCVMLTELSADYRRRAHECSERGQSLPEVGRDDLVMQVCFQDGRKFSDEKRRLRGGVIGTLGECSAAVKGVIDYILDGVPVSWPFDRSGRRRLMK